MQIGIVIAFLIMTRTPLHMGKCLVCSCHIDCSNLFLVNKLIFSHAIFLHIFIAYIVSLLDIVNSLLTFFYIICIGLLGLSYVIFPCMTFSGLAVFFSLDWRSHQSYMHMPLVHYLRMCTHYFTFQHCLCVICMCGL